MRRWPFDLASLVAGLVIAALGGLLLLDDRHTIDLSFAYLAPAVTATVGAILVASGLSRSRRG
jgi:hypothetical protein